MLGSVQATPVQAGIPVGGQRSQKSVKKANHGSEKSPKAQRDKIQYFLRVFSKNYQITQDNTLHLHTEGTGRWFLESAAYAAWKAGTGLKLACPGAPGTGKTVMSSIVIEDLKRSFPKSAVLFLYNDSISDRTQTTHILLLNLLSQVLEYSRDTHFPPEDIAQLFVGQPSNRPQDVEAARRALRSELSRCRRVFLIADALDEYQSGRPTEQQQFVQELESFGVSLLITSRHSIPFTGEHVVSEISASAEDLRRVIRHDIVARNNPQDTLTLTLTRSPARREEDTDVIAKSSETQHPVISEESIDAIVKQSDGGFLKPKLVLEYISRCKTPEEMKERLDEAVSLDIHALHEKLFDLVKDETPWVLRLFSLLLLAEDSRMGARAMIHYLHFPRWQDGDNNGLNHTAEDDNAYSDEAVLAAYRGLVAVIDQDNIEDRIYSGQPNKKSTDTRIVHSSRLRLRERWPSILDYGKSFRFSHKAVRDFLQRYPSGLNSPNPKIDLVHTLLQYAPQVLDYLVADESIDTTTKNDLQTARFLATHYPLALHFGLWLSNAIGIEDKVNFDMVHSCYEHPKFSWLASLSAEAPYQSTPDLPTALSTHGLLPLLQELFIRNPNFPLRKDGVPQTTALGEAARTGNFAIAALLLEHDCEVDLPDTNGRTPLTFAAERGDWNITSLLLANGVNVHFPGNPLLHACRNGHWDVATLLLQSGADVNEMGDEGQTPLICASILGDWPLTTTLVREGGRVNSRDEGGMTALMHACRGGHSDVVSLLVDNSADVHMADNNGDTALLHALKRGHAAVALLLISKNALVDVTNNDEQTPLMLACSLDRIEVASQVIERGGTVNSRDGNGSTPLLYASKNGSCDIASLLLRHGAAVDSADNSGQTALMVASSEGYPALVSLLLDRGVSPLPKDKTGSTSLTKAARHGHASIAKLLLNAGAKVDETDLAGDTALIHATRNNHPKVASILLENGADVHAVTQKDKQTPLAIAAIHGFDDTAAVLLKHGASQEPVDRDGWFPFTHAACRGHVAIVALFIENGHPVDIQDKDGWTPLIFASSSNHADVAMTLLKAGATVDLPDSRGWSPLRFAAQKSNMEIVKILLENGAQVEHKDNRGRTVLEWAQQFSRSSVLPVLQPSSSANQPGPSVQHAVHLLD